MTKTIVRLILGLIFLASGCEKISQLPTFLETLSHYQLLPMWLLPWVALILPYLEALCGMLLLLGLLTESNALICGILGCCFSLAVFSAWWRHLDITCGCFRVDGRVGLGHVGADLLLTLAAFWLMGRGSGPYALDNLFLPETSNGGSQGSSSG